MNIEELLKDNNFTIQLFKLKNDVEVKNLFEENEIILNEEEFEKLKKVMQFVSQNCKKNMSEKELLDVSAAVWTAGDILSLPVRAITYTLGAVIAAFPKGFYEGFGDVWFSSNPEKRWKKFKINDMES